MAIMIMGIMSTTVTDVLDVHADLLPFHLLVHKVRHRAALRLGTLPPSHPLYGAVRNARKRKVKRHPTTLHDLMWTYDIQPDIMETIQCVRQDTKWNPGLAIWIAEDKEVAIREDRDDRANIRVYTDGSGIDGAVGAAAVLYREGRSGRKVKRVMLGSDKKYGVYEGECVAMILGLELIQEERNVSQVSMCVDNEAAIQAMGLV